MLRDLINTPCTLTLRSKGTEKDEFGNRISNEDELETVCELQQEERDERDDQGELSDTKWVIFLPAGTEANTGDSVHVDGVGDFEFVGDPWPARNPRTQEVSHVEATLRRVSGSQDAEEESS